MAIGNGDLMHECFFQTLANGNNKYEIEKYMKTVRREESICGKKFSGPEKNKSQRPDYSWGLPSLWGSELPEAVDEK